MLKLQKLAHLFIYSRNITISHVCIPQAWCICFSNTDGRRSFPHHLNASTRQHDMKPSVSSDACEGSSSCRRLAPLNIVSGSPINQGWAPPTLMKIWTHLSLCCRGQPSWFPRQQSLLSPRWPETDGEKRFMSFNHVHLKHLSHKRFLQ